MLNSVADYSLQKVEPIYEAEANAKRELVFMPGITVAAGTVLGQVSSASASEVQTFTISAQATSGTFTLSCTGIDGGTYTTAALAWNIINSAIKTAVEALFVTAGYTGVTVTVGAGNATVAGLVTFTLTFGGSAASWDVPAVTATSTLLATATPVTITITSSTPGVTISLWGLYADNASDGRQTARAIATYTFRTDNMGRVVFGAVGSSPDNGAYHTTAPAWFKGVFRTTDLTGLDAAGVTDLGRLESGTVADGVLALI